MTTMAACSTVRRLLVIRPWNMLNNSTNFLKLLRQKTCGHMQRSKIPKFKSRRDWLYRLTGVGTGLSLCATPAIVPVDEKAKLLNIDPGSLTHSSLIRNAATVAVDAASALVSQTVIAAIELNQAYTQCVHEVITLYESHVIYVGVPVEDGIWQQIIEARVEADDARRAVQEVETVTEAALNVLEYAGEAAYQAGCEVAAISAGQRVTLARSQLEVAKTVSHNALQELTKVQEMSIAETSKRAEQAAEQAKQQEAEAVA